MNVTNILWIIFLVLALVGLLATIAYLVRGKVFQPRQWFIAGASGILWGIGGILGAVIVGEAWQRFFDLLYNGYSFPDFIYEEFGVLNYYSLALAGVLAGIFGCTALYFLLRKRPPAEAFNSP